MMDNDGTMKMILPDGTYLMLTITDFSEQTLEGRVWRVGLKSDGTASEVVFTFPKRTPEGEKGTKQEIK